MSSRSTSLSRDLTRRQALGWGGMGLVSCAWPLLAPPARQAAADDGGRGPSFGKAKACILLFMWGGPAHQDTFDLKPDAPAEYRGEFQPIASSVPGVHVCEHFPRIAERMHLLAQVRSMTHTIGDHTPGTHFLLTGEPPPRSIEERAQWPHLGAVLARLGYGRGALPPFVSMRPKLDNDVPRFVEQSQGQFAGWLGPVYDPLTIDHDPSRGDYRVAELALAGDVTAERLAARRELLGRLNQTGPGPAADAELAALAASQRRSFELLVANASQRGAFDLAQETPATRERYGLNPHGQSVLQARRLVERGVPLVTVFWPNDGVKNVSVYWDTHSRNFIDLKTRLMPVADQALAALLDDLRDRGLLDETLVVWTGEFGRTPKVGQRSSDAGAGADGRDHWPGCFTSVLAGGGARGGAVYGKSDRLAAYPASEPTAPRDLVATIYHLLGVPERQQVADVGGRPQFVRQGKVIRALLG